VKLDTNGSDYSALKALLKRQPDLKLDYLKDSASIFIGSTDKFHQGQGHPLRFWANNVNGFIPGNSNVGDQDGVNPWDPDEYQRWQQETQRRKENAKQWDQATG